MKQPVIFKYYQKKFKIYLTLILIGLLICVISFSLLIVLTKLKVKNELIYAGLLAVLISLGAILSLLFIPPLNKIARFKTEVYEDKIYFYFFKNFIKLTDFKFENPFLIYKGFKINLNNEEEVISFISQNKLALRKRRK